MSTAARWLHQRLPGYSPTPLVDAPALAERYGLDRLWLKDETNRFGLPSFKALGASWAAYQLLEERLGALEPWGDVAELRDALSRSGSITLVGGSQGNHGRALAWFAAQSGLSARIFLPAAATTDVREEIQREGAEVVVVKGDYDEAVDAAARSVGPNDVLVSDVARSEGDRGPSLVIDGYRTMLAEIDDQISSAGAPAPNVTMVPIGVGSLAAAVVGHVQDRSTVVGVEPVDAACVRASLDAGVPVTVSVPAISALPGLNCATPSITAWPFLATGLERVVTVDAAASGAAVRDLEAVGIAASPTGAAALAGLAAAAPWSGGAAVVLVTERSSSKQGESS